MNYPTPSGTKAQIFNAGSKSLFSIIDPQTAAAVNACVPTAFASVKIVAEDPQDFVEAVPSKDSLVIGTSIDTSFHPEIAKDNSKWIKLERGSWRAMALFDLCGYCLFVEDSEGCKANLARLKKSVSDSVLKRVVDQDLLAAYSLATESTPGAVTKEPPLYKRVNEELAAKYRDEVKDLDSLALDKIEEGLPFAPTSELAKKSGDDLGGLEGFSQYMTEVKKVSYGKPPPLGSVDKSTGPKPSKTQKSLRKRDLLLALMREKRPDRIQKLIQDLQKMNVNVRKAVISRWPRMDDVVVVQAAAGGASGGRAIDADYAYVLLVKIKQLGAMKAFDEIEPLMTALERLFNDKPWSTEKALTMQYLSTQKALWRMEEYHEDKGDIDKDDLADLTKEVKEAFDQLLKTMANGGADPSSGHVFEMAVVTLLNLGEFDFILERSRDKGWNLIRLASLMASMVVSFHRKLYNTPEFKQYCKTLADMVMPVLQQVKKYFNSKKIVTLNVLILFQGTKRSARDSNKDSQEKQWIGRLLRRIHNLDVLGLLCSFFITYYNFTTEDTEIQCPELPPLPLPVNSNVQIKEDSLLAIIKTLAKNSRNSILPWSLRVQAEVHFAQANYLAAMQVQTTSNIRVKSFSF